MRTQKTKRYSEILGWIGVILVLFSYGLLSLDIVDSQSRLYHSLVLLGSTLVAIISYKKQNFQPMVLNVTFAFLAIIALIRIAFS